MALFALGVGRSAAAPDAGASGLGTRGPPRAMPADVLLASPEVRGGGLDPELVRRIVRRHHPELVGCSAPVVARRRHLFGTLTIEITIGRSGDVRAAAPRRSAVRDAGLAGCFVEAIRSWQFPQSAGSSEVVVRQRFTLVPPHRSDGSWKGGKRR